MSLTFTIEQKQTISQGLIHMVNLLQMNRQDLLVYLEEQSMENPLLEVDDAIYSYMPSESEENWIEQLEGRKESLRDDLMEQLRANGIFDLRQVEFVLAETNGQLSIVKKAPFEPLSPKSAGIQVENTPPPVLVVDDRKVIEEGLKLCKMSEQELKKLLKKAGYRLEDVFLMTCTPQKDYYIVPLDPKERSN